MDVSVPAAVLGFSGQNQTTPSYVSSFGDTTWQSQSTFHTNAPSGLAAGDLIIASVHTYWTGTVDGTQVITPPAGWRAEGYYTSPFADNNNFRTAIAIFSRIATGTSADAGDWSLSPAIGWNVVVSAFRGVDRVARIEHHRNGDTDGIMATPTWSAQGYDGIAVAAFYHTTWNPGSFSTASGMIEAIDKANGYYVQQSLDYKIVGPSDAIGPYTSTHTPSAGDNTQFGNNGTISTHGAFLLFLVVNTLAVSEVAHAPAGISTTSGQAPTTLQRLVAHPPSGVLAFSVLGTSVLTFSDLFQRNVAQGLGGAWTWSDDDSRSRSTDPTGGLENVRVEGGAVILPSAPAPGVSGTGNYESFRPGITFPAKGTVQIDFWVPSLAGQDSWNPTYGINLDDAVHPVFIYVWPEAAGDWRVGPGGWDDSAGVPNVAFVPEASTWYTAQMKYDWASQYVEMKVWKTGTPEPALPNTSGYMNDITGPDNNGFPFIDLYKNAIGEDAKITNFKAWDTALEGKAVSSAAVPPRPFILTGLGENAAPGTDFRVFLFPHSALEEDVTGLAEWGVTLEESMGSPATASLTLQDRVMGEYDFPNIDPSLIGVTLERADVEVVIIGQEDPVFRGVVLNDQVDLPVAFPWRFHQLKATDYQRELFGMRYVGIPGGSIWTGPDSDGNFVAVDPRVYLSGADIYVVRDLFQNCAWLPYAYGTINTWEFVYSYTPSVDRALGIENLLVTPDRQTVGSVLDTMAGLSMLNVQYWIDQALKLHFVALPRWWQQPSDVPNPLEAAPADINNDNPDGVTSIGCRNLGWSFDYSSVVRDFYVAGGLGFAYNGGVVDTKGTGAMFYAGGTTVYEQEYPSPWNPQAMIDASWSVDSDTRAAAAIRAGLAVSQGILRGHCTVGNERHHPDGWHVGQVVKITDARMPAYLNGRYYVIQKVTTKLIPTVNWRVYDLEWGDAPIARSSSRRFNKEKTPDLPGRLWDISGRIQNPLPGSTVTVVGQLTDEKGTAVRVGGVAVKLELHVWDDTGAEVTGVGGISPSDVTSDPMGRWETSMSVSSDEGYYYCVCPVGSNSCKLPA